MSVPCATLLKLYFGNIRTTLSTLPALAFAAFFADVSARRGSISHWGILTLAVFFGPGIVHHVQSPPRT